MKIRAMLFALVCALGLGFWGAGQALAAPTIPMTAPAKAAALDERVTQVHGYHCYRAYSPYSGWHRSCYRPRYVYPRYHYKPYKPYKYRYKYKYRW